MARRLRKTLLTFLLPLQTSRPYIMGTYRAPSCTTVSSSNCSQASHATILSSGHKQQKVRAQIGTRLPAVAFTRNGLQWTNNMSTVREDRGPVAGPSTHARASAQPQPAQKRDKGKGKAKSRGEMNAGEKERLRMAYKKKKEAKPVIKPSQVQWSFVYVGNVSSFSSECKSEAYDLCVQLSSSVTDAQLAALFGPCGPIRRIQIRASGGICVPTANLPRPYFGFGKVDTAVHYATVEFESSDGSRKAMELNRRVLEGRQIIVCLQRISIYVVVQWLTSALPGHVQYC